MRVNPKMTSLSGWRSAFALALLDAPGSCSSRSIRNRAGIGSPRRCRVGYAIDVAGRSQTSIPFQSFWQATSSTAVEIGPQPIVTDDERNRVSYLGAGGTNTNADGSTGNGQQVSSGGTVEGYHKYGLVGSVTSGPLRTDYHTMVNIQKQWHKLSPDIGAVFIGNCHNSTLPMMDYDDVYDKDGSGRWVGESASDLHREGHRAGGQGPPLRRPRHRRTVIQRGLLDPWQHRCRKALDAAEAARDARERADRAETARLAAQAERDALQRELEAAANDTPVRHPDALGADRVRRLQQIR